MRSDGDWLAAAVELSRRCPPSDSAYAVGALVVAGGEVLAEGWSRDVDDSVHAEESALSRVAGPLPGATLYSSLEPCSVRGADTTPCARLILDRGIRRVVFALREPPLLADCEGAELLATGGVTVLELPALAPAVREINAAVLVR